MITFEGYDRRINKINECIAKYNLGSLENCKEICDKADINVEDLILNGSDIQTKSTFSLLPSAVFNILNANVSSRYFNLERI